jgi:hypothetical protein
MLGYDVFYSPCALGASFATLFILITENLGLQDGSPVTRQVRSGDKRLVSLGWAIL